MDTYAARLAKIRSWMIEEGISLLMLEDTEGRRDLNIRWLTGHPADALLFIGAGQLPEEEKAMLAAWDVNLAKMYVQNTNVAVGSYNDFGRQPVKAIAAVTHALGLPLNSKIEIPSVTPYPAFLEYVGELTDYDIICRQKGAGAQLNKMRAVKDEDEIIKIKKAAEITNEIIELITNNVKKNIIKTEIDAASTIETEARKRGCEGTSFETIAAGPGRSYGIHAFPAQTNGHFGTDGLSILDFGVKYQGYCTDVTLTFARNLNQKQEKLAALVEKAYKLALGMAHNGVFARDIAAAIDAFFGKSKKKMPHGLGHGIGLEEHEYPILRNRPDNEWKLEPGMVFTIEPGLYDLQTGGCRLENDILITEKDREVLTNAGIIYL